MFIPQIDYEILYDCGSHENANCLKVMCAEYKLATWSLLKIYF